MEKKEHKVILSLGSNNKNGLMVINEVCSMIARKFNVDKTTKIIKTKPFGNKNQPDFFNMLILISTEIFPFELLAKMKKIEQKYNSEKTKEQFWGQRNIDIDIIQYSDFTVFSQDLIIPHPGLKDREYLQQLMQQLNDIARIPDYQKSKTQIFG